MPSLSFSPRVHSMFPHVNAFTLLLRVISRKKSWKVFLGASLMMACRLSQFVAFFLPLKIFILMGSDRSPAYFGAGGEIDRTVILYSLIFFVPLAYTAFFIFGITSRRLIDNHYSYLEMRRALSLPELNVKVSRVNHGRDFKMLSDVMLTSVSILFALMLDAYSAAFWLSLLLLSTSIFGRTVVVAKDGDRLTWFKLHRKQCIEYLVSANFIFVFVALGAQLFFREIGIYEGMFLLLLSRLVFQALQQFTNEGIHLLKVIK